MEINRGFCLTLLVVLPLSLTGSQSQSRSLNSGGTPSCSQSSRTREAIIRQAEKMRFTVRRVTFIGITYTRYEVLNERMTNLQEGDLFLRRQLVNSLRSMRKLRNEIYPVKLSDVDLRLNESDQTIDITICFKPKRL